MSLRDDQHDPTRDITAHARSECFLCGRAILQPSQLLQFGLSNELDIRLDCHVDCLNGREITEVANEYHRRVHDLAGLARVH